MAFEITNKNIDYPPIQTSFERQEIADATATTSVTAGGQGDFNTGMRTWRAYVYQKAFTAGTGTVGPIYNIEVADNAAMSTNLRTVATGSTQRLDEQTLLIQGSTPFLAGQQFGRIKLTLSGTDTATFDAILEAV